MEPKDTGKCKLCQNNFEIDNAVVSNAITHTQGKIHKSKVRIQP